MSASRKRGARGYTLRAQRRAERRTMRANRRARESNTWPAEPRSDEVHKRLSRMFRGIHPIAADKRMEALERGRRVQEQLDREAAA